MVTLPRPEIEGTHGAPAAVRADLEEVRAAVGSDRPGDQEAAAQRRPSVPDRPEVLEPLHTLDDSLSKSPNILRLAADSHHARHQNTPVDPHREQARAQ